MRNILLLNILKLVAKEKKNSIKNFYLKEEIRNSSEERIGIKQDNADYLAWNIRCFTLSG